MSMEKLIKEIKETFWMWGSMLVVWAIIFSALYYHAHYCKQIPYNATCDECIKWEMKDNGRFGRYRQEWNECVEYKYYDCIKTYDSCGCNRINPTPNK